MAWLFDTSNFVSRMHCGQWDRWMILAVITSHMCYIFAYVLAPLCLIMFSMSRGKQFLLPKWIIAYFIIFMFVSCLIRLDQIVSFKWPAQRFFVIVESFGGVIAFCSVFVAPYIVTLATDIPTQHRLNNLKNENNLYKKLEELQNSQAKITNYCILKKLQTTVDGPMLHDIEQMLESLVQK